MSDDNKDYSVEKKIDMAKLTYGSVLKRCENYLLQVECSKKQAYLIMIDRYIKLCQSELDSLESEQKNLYYENLNNDPRLLQYSI